MSSVYRFPGIIVTVMIWIHKSKYMIFPNTQQFTKWCTYLRYFVRLNSWFVRYNMKPDSNLSHIPILIKCLSCYHISSDLETEFNEAHAQGIQLVFNGNFWDLCLHTICNKTFCMSFSNLCAVYLQLLWHKVISKAPYNCHIGNPVMEDINDIRIMIF